jgi:hypothetical protein
VNHRGVLLVCLAQSGAGRLVALLLKEPATNAGADVPDAARELVLVLDSEQVN